MDNYNVGLNFNDLIDHIFICRFHFVWIILKRREKLRGMAKINIFFLIGIYESFMFRENLLFSYSIYTELTN